CDLIWSRSYSPHPLSHQRYGDESARQRLLVWSHLGPLQWWYPWTVGRHETHQGYKRLPTSGRSDYPRVCCHRRISNLHLAQGRGVMRMANTDTDLLGSRLTEQERELLNVYEALKKLASQDDLPPCAARNVRRALMSMWQATNDLDLQFEQLYEFGV